MTTPAPESARRIGVVVVPDSFDTDRPMLGLSPLLRHALAMQAAGCELVVLQGKPHSLPPDARLRIPVSTEIPEHGAALVVRADVTTHRTVPPRLAAESLEGSEGTLRVGDDEAGFFYCRGDRTAALATGLAQGHRAPFDRAVPLLPGVSAEFVVRCDTESARRSATFQHLVSLRKPTSGYFERLYMRPLSLFITWPLAGTRVTPNAMSVVTFVLGMGSAAMVAIPDVRWNIAGALTHLFMRVVDCVDGELSRLRYQGSAFGAWLDSICDGISMAAFVFAVGYRLSTLGSPYAVVGYVGAAVWMLVQLLEWRGVYLAGTGGSVQAIEWGHRAKEPSLLERFVGRIELLLRMDAISTYYGVMVIVGALVPIVVVHTVVSSLAAIYYVVQLRKLPTRAA